MKLICIKNDSDCTYFTDRKIYPVNHCQGNLKGIIDDLGYLRYVLPGHLCAHLMREVVRTGRYPDQKAVGRFEIIEDKL